MEVLQNHIDEQGSDDAEVWGVGGEERVGERIGVG